MSDEKSQKVELSEKVELAIRDEVEKRLDHPSGEFVKFIEAEVERRVSFRVKQYKKLAWVTVAFLIAVAAIVYHQSIVEAGREAIRQVAGTEAVKAAQRVIALAEVVERQSQRVNGLAANMATNYDDFTQRLEQLQKKDNVVLLGKDGSLNLKGPVRFHGDVTFDRTTFSGAVCVHGTWFQIAGTPAAFWVVDESAGRITVSYNAGPMPSSNPPFQTWGRVASTFGDVRIP